MKFWKDDRFVLLKPVNVTQKKLSGFSTWYPTTLASENCKRNAVHCAQPKNYIREVDPNHFVMIVRVAIKKKKKKGPQINQHLPPPNNL